ncbi:hypothetical protein [Sutcliffiella rhizosphaerae]|uniref:Uncharacterized protein n=1 Tax=Sutcliffiella rhizosphaerae TaxID=2880967 RepID=A0ABM8YTL2_9BACI|nr:hypothetical protein [Sutcliffiella rhizosphaerae]CAG9623304.1 hypothetical protein BACCIP111883_04105 [Sutcliffiella rhizosphaerae]
MKDNKKYIFIFGLSLIILISVFGYNSNKSFAGKVYPLEGYSFELTQLDVDGRQNLLIQVDENGFFYKEILNGPEKGGFELWDGENFYRYMKEFDELVIFESAIEDVGKVIAHPFLSEIVNEEIENDLEEGKLRKSFFGKTYSSKYKKGKNEIVEKLEFSEDVNHPEKYELTVNGVSDTFIEITNIDNFNEGIKAIDFVDINELTESGTEITEVREDLN